MEILSSENVAESIGAILKQFGKDKNKIEDLKYFNSNYTPSSLIFSSKESN
ncbi:MAG: hypothetical protein GF383_15510 [Candidatus Lokiarchaeota archaeon]|nr:hypothetical protein [Candidatus Lokiarchaeota archaeon]MBD3342968.1 hypothetical protein [Candidatus Lokiarchaeota archaeon]